MKTMPACHSVDGSEVLRAGNHDAVQDDASDSTINTTVLTVARPVALVVLVWRGISTLVRDLTRLTEALAKLSQDALWHPMAPSVWQADVHCEVLLRVAAGALQQEGHKRNSL